MTVTEERKAAEAWIKEAGPYHGCSMPVGGHLFELYVSCFLAGAAWQKLRDLEIIGARAIALAGEGRGRESEGAIDCSNHVAEDAKQGATNDGT